MSIKLTFEVHLRSDYHIGSGHRSELVDSALFRDADGIPAIRGTTLAALLRDGLRRLIVAVNSNTENAAHNLKRFCKASGLEDEKAHSYCGQFEQQDETCPICLIFGSPKSIKPWAVSSARPLNLLTSESRRHVPNWASQDTMRVRVDPRSRRAEARKLFSQEEGDSRLKLAFMVTSVSSKEEEKEAALIMAAARMVRNFGGSRRRGRGECVIELSRAEVDGDASGTQEEWLEKFKSYWLNGKTPDNAKKTSPKKETKPAKKKATGKPLRLNLLVRADEPILIARRAEAGNEFDGLETIPGTVVRGAFAEMAANALEFYSGDKTVRPNFIELFFSEHVRFSPLYPIWVKGGQYRQTFPAPLDFHTCKIHAGLGKSDAGVLWKVSSKNDLDKCECRICKEKLPETKPDTLRGHIYVSNSGELKTLAIDKQLEMHNTINPDTGRVLETNLFSYVAIPGGQFFTGEVYCEDENLAALLLDMANLQGVDTTFSLKLGKASRRGYGRTTAVLQKAKEKAAPLWIGKKLEERVTDLSQTFYLTMLTDAIIPDCWGRFYTGFEKEWLSEVLQMPVKKVERQFVAAREIDSFNAHLGLPRWRDVALVAGSSCAIKIKTDSEAFTKLKESWAQQNDGDAENAAFEAVRWQLEKLEHEGIGLRRNEGFGHIAFNHPIYLDPSVLKSAQSTLPDALKLKTGSTEHVFTIEADFCKTWEEDLMNKEKIKLHECDHANFGAVARLLRAEAHHAITQMQDDDLFAVLNARLDKLGVRSNLDDELPPNEKNWFTEGKGKEGLKQIRKAIESLGKKLQSKEYQAHKKELAIIGIGMLADRIAAEANQAEQGA